MTSLNSHTFGTRGLDWLTEWRDQVKKPNFQVDKAIAMTSLDIGSLSVFGQCFACKKRNEKGWHSRQLDLRELKLDGKDNIASKKMMCPEHAHAKRLAPVGVTAIVMGCPTTILGSIQFEVVAECLNCGKRNGPPPPRYFPELETPKVLVSTSCCAKPMVKLTSMAAKFTPKIDADCDICYTPFNQNCSAQDVVQCADTRCSMRYHRACLQQFMSYQSHLEAPACMYCFRKLPDAGHHTRTQTPLPPFPVSCTNLSIFA